MHSASDNSLAPNLRDVIDLVPVRIFWKDLDLRYLGCNLRFAEDAGLSSPAEIVGKTDFELSWNENADLYRSDDSRVIDSGESKVSYEEPQKRDGTETWLLTSKHPLKMDGKIVGVLGSYDDITAHRSQRIAAERKSRMEAVGQMAAGIAHDFNNLLVPISGYADLAFEQSEDDPSIQAYKKGFDRAVNHAKALSSQLLSFSHDEALPETAVCPNRTIKNLLPLLKRLVGRKIKVQTQLTKKPGTVFIDPTRLERVIINLVNNAKDAMPAGGMVRIQTNIVDNWPMPPHIQSQKKRRTPLRSSLLMTISDTGLGIPPDIQPNIFRKFVSTKNSSSGSVGLGLAICNDIVKDAGGCIQFKSRPEQGAEFQVFLPQHVEGRNT